MRRWRVLILGAVATLSTSAVAIVGPAAMAGAPIDCSEFPGNTIDGVVEGNVQVTEHATICTITGTVRGNVTVTDNSPECAIQASGNLTAVNVVGGTVAGNVKAVGDRCAMAWFRDGATVGGNVIFEAAGNLGFLGSGVGSTVHGNVLLKDGLLWATNGSTTNRVDGHIICNGGQPKEGLGSGSPTNWDGFEDDVDGTIGRHYLGC